jgi:hypothetical protein
MAEILPFKRQPSTGLMGYDHLIDESHFDASTSIMSLPGCLGVQSWDHMPPPVSATHVPWHPIPLRLTGFCWRAEENGTVRKFRSLDKRTADALTQGQTWLSLVPKNKALHKQDQIEEFDGVLQDDDALPDWTKTTTTVFALDGVITVDTAVAHLAGSLGVPTLCLNPRRSDWKWGVDSLSTPLYPSMTLYREQDPRGWTVSAINEAITNWKRTGFDTAYQGGSGTRHAWHGVAR